MTPRDRRIALVGALWRRGLSVDAIAEIVGIDGSSVSWLARENGEASRGNPFCKAFWMTRQESSKIKKLTEIKKIFARIDLPGSKKLINPGCR